jgi:ESS family glutamate:Na+ symporter
MGFSWSILLDLGIVSLALLVATLIRSQVYFFQKYLIPNSITAGFLLLPFYNYVGPLIGLSSEGLGNLVFHLLNLSFIAMSLRTRRVKTSGKGIFSMVVAIISQYSLQSLVGIGVTFLFIATIIPTLFPSFGLLITLGFALGPGQAFSIGTSWEKFGFSGGGSVGLTFAAIGFLWACFGGIFLINRAIRKNRIENDIRKKNEHATKNDKIDEQRQSWQGSEIPTGAIDPLTYNLAYVLGIYLVTFLVMKLLTSALSLAGNMGKDLAEGLWAITFIFAAMIAVMIKKILWRVGIASTIYNQRLNRIAGTSVDIMVTASIAAISIVALAQYWLPIIVLAILGGIATILTVLWLSSRMFRDHIFQRTILIYGAMTGTLPTGLALLRVIDPELESPASSDYMYAVGIVFIFALPFIFSMHFPAYGYTTGRFFYYWITFLVYLFYMIFVLIAFRLITGKGAFRKAGKIWRESQ